MASIQKDNGDNLLSTSVAHTRLLGSRLGRLAQPGDVILLVGDLGTGKTCLTQGIALGLDIPGPVRSPSFTIMNQYRGRLPLYHIDLFRLERLEEILDLGLDDYFYGIGLCVMEWADRALDILPQEHLKIELQFAGKYRRRLFFQPRGKRHKRMLAKFMGKI